MKMADQAVQQQIEEVEEDQEKDPSVHSFTLSAGCSWPNAVKWSFDGRIAILADNVIHVLVSFHFIFDNFSTIFMNHANDAIFLLPH